MRMATTKKFNTAVNQAVNSTANPPRAGYSEAAEEFRTMSAPRRQKACNACANSKRKCDRQMPECQRCLDRDIDCDYPRPKRRRRDPPAGDNDRAGNLLALQSHVDPMLGSAVDFGNWNPLDIPSLDIDPVEFPMPYAPLRSPTPVLELTSAEFLTDGDSDLNKSPPPWFLEEESWETLRTRPKQSCTASVVPDSFVHVTDAMLQQWITNGNNGFIHSRLYENGLPTCLQDAFTTLSTYSNRTPAVKDTILQIAEQRAASLILQESLEDGRTKSLLSHLARVQALFVYEYIRLFDGSVRQRALAERELPTLRHWVKQMWEAVKRYRGEEYLTRCPSLQWTSPSEGEVVPSAEIWRSWIVTESARRTHIIVTSTLNMYQIMKGEWAQCDSDIMITVRRGLWEAPSASRWLEMCSAKPPLLVPSTQPEVMISEHAADEVDDFAKTYWTFIVGTDKIQSWVDRSLRPKPQLSLQA
ncbi:hypothetical protein BX600DRAFT_475018 [Xylariales sp. PMI_506]|nr:hypothetical protein BX600DRAFT_475018 [Xylariales sp. PMI_506]